VHTLKETEEPFAGVCGFMCTAQEGALVDPGPYAILGPAVNPQAGYGYASMWDAWVELIKLEHIPRANAFGHTGCEADIFCPFGFYCQNAGDLGYCLPE
jgi:hypothetical protein